MEKCKQILAKILLLTFVVVGTTSVLYYAKGYRLNLEDQSIITTGVLNIETIPRRANFWLTEDFNGRTPRTVSSIPNGTYTLNFWLDGYHDLEYEIEILPERSTPISAFLFKEKPTYETIAEIEEEITHIEKTQEGNIFLLTKEENADGINYELLKYDTNRTFWQFNDNPESQFNFTTEEEQTVQNIYISPNESYAIIDIFEKGRKIVSLDQQEILTSLENIGNTPKWSQDSLYFLWLEEDLMKVNIEQPEEIIPIYQPKTNTTLISYDTDKQGNLYVLYENTEEEIISLAKIDSEGDKTPVLETIYYREEQHFLSSWQAKHYIKYKPFKNAPESTLFIGKPETFNICLETESIILTTAYALYQYDINTNRYTLINPYPSKFLEFSPDDQKLSFLDLEKKRLGIFVFDREAGNRATKLGGYYGAENVNPDSCPDFAWHPNSLNIYYTCDNKLYVSDIHGFNNLKLAPFWGNYVLTENQNKVTTLLEYKNIEENRETIEDVFEEDFEHSAILEATIN